MPYLSTEVLVIGGGATGTGILRDLAMRGFKAILVERRDLSHGTTGRYHGLLHSGGRYVVKDPQAALECIEENRILRRIMPQCIEDTGGFFVTTPDDDPDYALRFNLACKNVGIPVDEIPVSKMLVEEPLLNPAITRCFRVPDASADSFLASELNADSACSYGAQVLVYHEVNSLLSTRNRIVGAICTNIVNGEPVEIHADFVVNAGGAWAGKIASTAGISIKILPGKGTMLAINHRVVHTVVNRCKMPSDGDILVPAHTVAVLGTTDVTVQDPDRFSIEPWEVQLLLTEGEKIIPSLRKMRILRAWAGVRPLYQYSGPASTSRDLSRAFVLLDHTVRDGIDGMVTITSGKWTTFRLMAEKTVDKVCEKLNTHRACRTQREPVTGKHKSYHYLGSRLAQIEHKKKYANLICECELATQEDIVRAVTYGKAITLDDIRRETRLGMGPCQGGFCTLRAAGILHDLSHNSYKHTNAAIRDFLQERWKGLLPILEGSQLRQERLDELIYLDVLNVPALPGLENSPLIIENYDRPAKIQTPDAVEHEEVSLAEIKKVKTAIDSAEILVIGSGLAGLVAAWQASRNHKKVSLITKGWGATHWASGSLDVLGYLTNENQPILDLPAAINQLASMNPEHPYKKLGTATLESALEAIKTLSDEFDYPLRGTVEQNILLPSSIGAARPTCIAPQTMVDGDLQSKEPMVIVGFEGFLDFFPLMMADNIQAMGIPTSHFNLNHPLPDTTRQITGMVLARAFDDPDFEEKIIRALKDNLTRNHLGHSQFRLGLPAVLGLRRTKEIWQNISNKLCCKVFEIPGLPSSIPGIRLHNLLQQSIIKNGGRIYNGQKAITAECSKNKVEMVYTEAAARYQPHFSDHVVLATGGVLGGGFVVSRNSLHEVVFNLPVLTPPREEWFNNAFMSSSCHPIFRSGIQVNDSMQPIDKEGETLFDNLFVVGAALGNFDPIHERSLEGVAVASGFTIGQQISQDNNTI